MTVSEPESLELLVMAKLSCCTALSCKCSCYSALLGGSGIKQVSELANPHSCPDLTAASHPGTQKLGQIWEQDGDQVVEACIESSGVEQGSAQADLGPS